jgi:hypothetical protein
MTQEQMYDGQLGKAGEFFFHYTKAEPAFAKILPSRQLRLSPASQMRDPLESRPADVLPRDAGDADSLQAMCTIRDWRLRSKILSLTVDAVGCEYQGQAQVFGRGWSRARLWESYAETHAGVCLMFRRREFEATVLKQLRARSQTASAASVSYTPTGIFKKDDPMLVDASGGSAEDSASRYVASNLDLLFFTKLNDWESEHEYRFVEPSLVNGYTCVDIEDTLHGVIFGHRFPSWVFESAYRRCKEYAAGR